MRKLLDQKSEGFRFTKVIKRIYKFKINRQLGCYK